MQLNMEEIAKTSSDYSGGSGPRIRKHSSSSAGSGQGHGTNNVRTWQSILDGLTIKARKDGLLRAVQNERGFEARIRKVLDSIAVRNKLSSWISQCSETHYAKSGSTATRLRDEGNLKFRAHDNEGSLRLYTESVICAPEFGPELSLALANRSACLYHQAQYETCLQDISLSLQFRYPKNLEYKLLQRKAQCLTKLSRFKEAEEAFKAANDALDFVPKLSPEKRGRLIKDNEALLRENNIGAGLQLLSEARVENERLKKEQNASLEENMSRSLKLTDNKTSNATSCDINKQPLINFSSDVKFKVPPAYGVNPTFCSASAAIECVDANSTDMGSNTDPGSASKDNILKESKIRGRHVVADQNIDVGSVLFSELPYSSVLLPEHYSTHCHQCYTSLIAPIPCLRCTQPRYCSDQCRQESWINYHQYECTCLDLLHSVGIAHLAVRTIFTVGLKKLVSYRSAIKKVDDGSGKDVVSYHLKSSVGHVQEANGNNQEQDEPYINVLNLVTHIDNLEAEDLFQYVVTAALLTTYLERRTNFFDSCIACENDRSDSCSAISQQNTNAGCLKTGESNSVFVPPIRRGSASDALLDSVDEELLIYVGSTILRHITQLICNASAIYEVGPSQKTDISSDNYYSVNCGLEPGQAGGQVVSNNQYRIATAIYPSASMMNHSCNPSVINSFFGRRLIVRAIKKTASGEEIFNCYGPHFRRHTVQERQEMLKSQYHFTCRCNSCSNKELEEFQERFSALKCMFCSGPIRNPHSEASLNHQMPCLDCGKQQEYKSQIEQVFLAYDLFRKGMECLRFGNMADAIPALQSCYQLRTKAMYSHHLEVTEVADQLARCYAMMGSFSESAQYLKVCLPAIQERFGSSSVEVGHELVKYTDVLLGELQDSTKRISLYEEKVLEANTCLERAAQIFELHYGTWNKTYQEIVQRLEKMKFLVDSANRNFSDSSELDACANSGTKSKQQ